MAIKILLVDDHIIFLQSLSMLIDSLEGYEIIGLASDGMEALAFLENEKPDVILCDQEMPEMNGIETTMHIKEQFPEIKVIMLTMHIEAELFKHAIEIGMDGMLSKKTNKEELVIAIDSIMNGQSYFSNELKFSEQHLSDAQLPLLTKRETEILNLLAKGHSYKMIAEFCGISYFTANTHLKSIYKKLHVNSATEAVAIASKTGLISSYG